MIHAAKNFVPFARVLAVILLLSCSVVTLFGASPSPWSVREWHSEDGLPEENVTGVAQTPEGYLWLTTHSGLARFDGVRFVPVKLPVSAGHETPMVRSFFMGADASLWLGLELEGGMVIQIVAGETKVFTSANGLPNFRPLVFAQPTPNEVWVAYTDGSACRISGGKVTRFTASDGLPGTGPCWLACDNKGTLWFAKAGRVGVFRDGAFVTLFTFQERNVRIAAAVNGGMWICAGKRLFQGAEGVEPKQVGEIQTDKPGVEPSVLFEPREGGLWVGTIAGGLFYFDGVKLTAADTSHSDVDAITQDREGNVWVGTVGGGLNRLRNRVLELHGSAMGLPFDATRSVCVDNSGEIWAAGANGSLVRTRGGVWQTVPEGAGWYGQRATCVCSDNAGGVWVGTYRGGLYHFTGGKFTALRRTDGLASDSVRTLVVDRTGDLWITFESPNAVQRFHAGVFKNFAQPETTRTVRTMTEDAAGNIWMGTQDGNLLRVDGDVIKDESDQALHPVKPIRELHATSDGALWIGYAGSGLGILRDGKFTHIDADHGLHDNFICGIISDEKGSLWFSSSHGIFSVRQRELEEFAAGKVSRVLSVAYGRNESMPNVQGSYGYSPAAARGMDGRVWFATRSGIVAANVDRVQPNRIPPMVVVERVLVDGKVLKSGGANTTLRLPPDHRNIEIEFTALSYTAPEGVKFRHQLQQWDTDWIEDGSLSQRSITYTRLPAGDYQFDVTACNNAGVWNETGAALRFRVEPYFWQKWWFRVMALTAFTLGIVGIVRYVSFRRLRARLQKLEHEATLNKERSRIAKDIHDDVGASFAQIAMLGELARADIAEPDKAVEHVEKMADVAREGINALDEIVWAVNPSNDTLAHFLDYAGQYAVDYLRPAGVRCRVDMPHVVAPRSLPADVRHGLFLIVKESLHNVVKHSRAKEVWLRVTIADSELTMSIQDDGQGFSAAPDNAMADGLKNMRERMKELGGVCEITSLTGKGTTVRLVLPWKHPDK